MGTYLMSIGCQCEHMLFPGKKNFCVQLNSIFSHRHVSITGLQLEEIVWLTIHV
jgi:hypothetical protein